MNDEPETGLGSKSKENQVKVGAMPEKQVFNQPNRRGRPSRKTKSRGEIDELLMSWRGGGEAGRKAAQILLEKYKIRAVMPSAVAGKKEAV